MMKVMPTRNARSQTKCRRGRRRRGCPGSSHPRQGIVARYYDPTVGRFTAVDPLADLAQPGSLDAFGYARGNPISFSDPSGLLPIDCVDGSATCTNGGGGSGDWEVTPTGPPQAPPAVPVPVGPSPEAIEQQISEWLGSFDLRGPVPTWDPVLLQYLAWDRKCGVFEEEFCVAAQVLGLGGSIDLAESLMAQCTIGNRCQSDGVVRDYVTEFFLIDLPAGLLSGAVVKGLPGLARAGAMTGDRGAIGGPNLGNLKQVKASFVKSELGIDAHAFKTEVLGRGATISRYNIYRDGKDLYLVETSTGSIVETGWTLP